MKQIGGWSIDDIANEAARTPGACPHVKNPRPPSILFGGDLNEMVAAAKAWGRQAQTASGGKYRKNQPIAGCGVFSCPRDHIKLWEEAKTRFIDYLRRTYEDRLKTVVEHHDESHPHLHFYLVPRNGESFGAVHPGYQESRAERKKKPGDQRSFIDRSPQKKGRGPGFEIGARFREAMHQWQDDIYTEVCEPLGFLRISPNPKPRKSRATVMRERFIDAQRKKREAREDQDTVLPTPFPDIGQEEQLPPPQEQVVIAHPTGDPSRIQALGRQKSGESQEVQSPRAPNTPLELQAQASRAPTVTGLRNSGDAKPPLTTKNKEPGNGRPTSSVPDANSSDHLPAAQGRSPWQGSPKPRHSTGTSIQPTRASTEPAKVRPPDEVAPPPIQDGVDDEDPDQEDGGGGDEGDKPS